MARGRDKGLLWAQVQRKAKARADRLSRATARVSADADERVVDVKECASCSRAVVVCDDGQVYDCRGGRNHITTCPELSPELRTRLMERYVLEPGCLERCCADVLLVGTDLTVVQTDGTAA